MTSIETACPRGAHLVGSVPGANSEEVFRLATSRLGRHLRRIPDGETGPRWHWISWQYPLLKSLPFFEPANQSQYYTSGGERWRVKAGVKAAEIVIPPLGYAAAAIESYEVFSALKAAGEIPDEMKFQVSLPTPLAPVHALFDTDSQPIVEPAYERRMLADVADILKAVPNNELALQWDVAIEFAILEEVLPTYITDSYAGFAERIARISAPLPEAVELGFHLCYGDSGGKHFMEPQDTSKLVAMANAISAAVSRSIQWIHMPVPRERSDDAYFAPLANLVLPPQTELYLGLMHLADGAQGAEARIHTARKYVQNFGVGTECGMGRQPAPDVPTLMGLHALVSAPVR